MSSEPYSGPSAAHMLATRTFASSVMSQHNTPNAILDDAELAFLKDFSADPSRKDSLLSARGMADAVGDRPGAKAAEKGSLTGVVVARCGTAESALGEGDVEMLRGWFEDGGAGV